ncbi:MULTISPECIES: M20 family metallopeptidase [unclassified Psychrobacter]|uniref:M20 family metallopeptidase n=1 Tax=unclassified Psychrobacter TaxID=196806 RepID=UPI0015CD0000|nr:MULTISPECIES: M20 family metallopeptidase [unclassified Psychrobacter]NYR10374.1 amidohydrolase [Psychrobacter sp. BI730]
MKKSLLSLVVSIAACSAFSAHADINIDEQVKSVENKVIEWRRDIHQHPELSNRETRTAAIVAKHLKSLGMQVETDIAHTGVVGYLKGAKPGPTVMLRADMDALPVTEKADVPFKSTIVTKYMGEDVGVMHACGHDTHVAMLMGTAEVLAGVQNELHGNIMFVFQPAEEGPPTGEEGGANLMLKQGIFKKYKPDVAFGLHIMSSLNTGQIGYRSGPIMASADTFDITVKGKQTHGSAPWNGVDPIAAASQIVTGINHIVSRQVDITKEPAIISFGKISGGIRDNIIPDSVNMIGTIRNFDMDNRDQIFNNIKTTATHIAMASGAEADVKIIKGYPVTINNPALTAQMLPTLKSVAGADNVFDVPKLTASEDFSFYSQEVPGLFIFLGGTPAGQDTSKAPYNHSPYFYADEASFKVGTKALSQLAIDYLAMNK